MTLTRPAYEITVENLDNPWTMTVTQGVAPGDSDVVWLADGLELGWAFDGPPPAQLEPEVAQFVILAKGIANLPTFTEGDRVRILLQRPTLADPITYMDFTGRITDADLTTAAVKGRVLLEVTAVDPTSELSHEADYTGGTIEMDPTYFAWGGNIWGQDFAAYYLEEVVPANPPIDPAKYRWWDAPTVAPPKQAMNTAEFITRILPPTLMAPSGEGSMAVQRYVVDELTGPEWQLFTPSGGISSPWRYFLAQWRPEPDGGTLPTLFEYVWDPADADRVTIERIPVDLPADPAVIPLDARYVPDEAEWTKDRTTAPNRINVTGTRYIDAQNVVEASPGVATDQAALERYGAITRTVETFTRHTSLSALAAKYLSMMPANAADAWMLEDTTIKTHLMDDDTLDAYAPLFWTPREPVPGIMGKPVLLYGVDSDVDPTGGYLFAHLAGVTFKVEGGKLAIIPELVPALAPPLGGLTSDSPTYDEFGASAFGAAKYKDPGGGGDYMDPTLTYDRAKLTAL
jgi:hypothetical protein